MAELDAAESTKRKTEQVEMAKETCLCLVSYEKLFVIKLSNLKKQEVDVRDWTCLPPPDFDFVLKLPESDLCPFEFDSKIYMAFSALPRILSGKSVFMRDLELWPIYEFKFEERSIGRAESLDDAPLPFHESFVANTPGSGDVYFYIDLNSRVKDSSGCYVLRSGSRVWKPLFAPPTISGLHVNRMMFVLHNNLFVSSNTMIPERDSRLARFDPMKESWTVESVTNNLSNFINGRLIGGNGPCRITFHPHISVSLPDLCSSNYTVSLTHEYTEEPPLMTPLYRIFAILVDHQNGRVALYQYLDMCFNGIQPTVEEGARLNFVDLGNLKLCAILTGDLFDSNSNLATLCFSVFTLTVDIAALQLDSVGPPEERNFLQVTVHSKCLHHGEIETCYSYATRLCLATY